MAKILRAASKQQTTNNRMFRPCLLVLGNLRLFYLAICGEFPNNPDSKRQRGQKGTNICDGLCGFETCDAKQPRHD